MTTSKRSLRPKRPRNKVKSRHKITFELDTDLEVAVRGALGQTTKAIARRTKLTECMVQYRLSKARIKRADYRNATSPIALTVTSMMMSPLSKQFQRKLTPLFT